MSSDENFLDDHTFLGDGHPDTLDQRLARELPESATEDVPYQRQPDAVGDLIAVPDDQPFEEQDVMAEEAPFSREDASAVEAGVVRETVGAQQAAMHLIPSEGDLPEEDYSAFTSDVEDDEEQFAEDAAEEETAEVEEADSIGRDDDSGEFVFDAEYDQD